MHQEMSTKCLSLLPFQFYYISKVLGQVNIWAQPLGDDRNWNGPRSVTLFSFHGPILTKTKKHKIGPWTKRKKDTSWESHQLDRSVSSSHSLINMRGTVQDDFLFLCFHILGLILTLSLFSCSFMYGSGLWAQKWTEKHLTSVCTHAMHGHNHKEVVNIGT
jgi:hypothetical protein